jgi:hypothetical protein
MWSPVRAGQRTEIIHTSASCRRQNAQNSGNLLHDIVVDYGKEKLAENLMES